MKSFAILSILTGALCLTSAQTTWAQTTDPMLPDTFSFSAPLKDKDPNVRTSTTKPVQFNGQKLNPTYSFQTAASKYLDTYLNLGHGGIDYKVQAIYSVDLKTPESNTYYLPNELVSAAQRTIYASFLKQARKEYLHRVTSDKSENFLAGFIQWDKFEESAKAYSALAKEIERAAALKTFTPDKATTFELGTPAGNWCSPGGYTYFLTMIPVRLSYHEPEGAFTKMLVIVTTADYCGED